MLRSWRVAPIVLLAATAVSAQSVPLVSAEVTGGGGGHTSHTSQIYFVGQKAQLWRVGGALRIGSPGRVRPIVSLDYAPGCGMGWGCGHIAICYIAPNGTCAEWFVDPMGFAIGGGVAAAPNRYLAASITTGPGFFQQRSWYLAGNVSLRVVPHFAIVADARHILSTDGRGGRTWFFPVSFGLKGY